jgi:sucrose-6-phosphate hydrolase SacC (GH32 family)
VGEAVSLREKTVQFSKGAADSAAVQELFAGLPAELLDIELEFEWADSSSDSFGVLFSNQFGEEVVIAVNTESGLLYVDRTTIGQRVPNPKFAGRFKAPLRKLNGSLDLRIVKDRASVEVFCDGGRSVISANLFFDTELDSVSIAAFGDVKVSGSVSVLNSIW